MAKTSDIQSLPQKEVEIDGKHYLITALGAMKALEYNVIFSRETGPTPAEIRQLIINSVTVDGYKIDEKFDTMFACKLTQMYQLLGEIFKFNYADAFQEDDSDE